MRCEEGALSPASLRLLEQSPPLTPDLPGQLPPPPPHPTCRSSPVATSHSRTVLSREPEASVVPPGETATLHTELVWPSSTWGAAGPGGGGGRG